jgi:hypothetical protein
MDNTLTQKEDEEYPEFHSKEISPIRSRRVIGIIVILSCIITVAIVFAMLRFT